MVAVFAGDAFLKTTVDSGRLFIGESEIFRLVSYEKLPLSNRSPVTKVGIPDL